MDKYIKTKWDSIQAETGVLRSHPGFLIWGGEISAREKLWGGEASTVLVQGIVAYFHVKQGKKKEEKESIGITLYPEYQTLWLPLPPSQAYYASPTSRMPHNNGVSVCSSIKRVEWNEIN